MIRSSNPSFKSCLTACALFTLGSVLATSLTAQREFAPTLEDSPTRLSSNENAFGFTPEAKRRMIANIDSGGFYNRNDVIALGEACAKREGLPNDYILTTPGSGPVLMMTALAYAEEGKNVVTTEMGYSQLTRKFEALGGDVKYAKLGEDMGYDLEAVKALIDDDTVIVYICNPNNPTGVLIDPMELRQFVLSVRSDILVFVDEAYLELADTPFALNTMAPLVNARKNLIISRTFSKSFGMAGFRIGYGIAHPDILEKLRVYHMGSPTYLSAIAGTEAIRDTEFMANTAKKYQTIRKYVTDKFDAMGIEYAQPSGAFVYFKTGIDQQVLRDEMAMKGVLISGSRESGVPEGTYADWARVSIGTQDQMDQFLEILSDMM